MSHLILIDRHGNPIAPGDTVMSSRGDTAVVRDIYEPHKSNSTGKVYVAGTMISGLFYVGVFGLKWVSAGLPEDVNGYHHPRTVAVTILGIRESCPDIIVKFNADTKLYLLTLHADLMTHRHVDDELWLVPERQHRDCTKLAKVLQSLADEAQGSITMRNEDGSHWLEHSLEGDHWNDEPDPDGPVYHPRSTYNRIKAGIPRTNARDCPDNGMFGVYALKFTLAGDVE
jgi:hypothetical protein